MKLKKLLYLLLATTLVVACDPVEDELKPVLTLTSASEMNFTAEGGEGVITYALENPQNGTNVEASCEAAWVTNVTVGENVTYTVAANEGEAREAKVVVKYGKSSSFEVTVKQAAVPAKPVYTKTVTLTVDSANATWRTGSVAVEVSEAGMGFVIYLMPKAEWDENYAADPQKIADDRVAGWKADAENLVGKYPDLDTWQKWMALEQKKGSQNVALENVRNLYWAQDYVIYCFGMDDDGTQTTDVVTADFSTATPEASTNKISIAVGGTDSSSVEFVINTTNDDPYYVSIQSTDYLARFLGEEATETLDDMIFDLTFSKTDNDLLWNVFSGSGTLTNTDINKKVNGFKEYKVVVWGFDGGPTTTPVFSAPFTPGTTNATSFTIENGEAVENVLTATITPSDENVTYYAGFYTEERIGEDGGAALASELIAADGFENMLLTGTQTFSDTMLAGGNYQLVVFAYDTTTGSRSSYVYLGEAQSVADVVAFSVELSDVTWCDVAVKVMPITEDDYYIMGGMTKAEFDAGGYADDLNQLYEKEKAIWKADSKVYNQPWQQCMTYYAKTGTNTYHATDLAGRSRLRWAQDYVFYFFGVDTSAKLTTDILLVETATDTPVASDMTFEIEVAWTTASEINFSVIPSNEDEQYYVTLQRKSVIDSYGPNGGYTNDDLIAYLLPEFDVQLESRLFTGSQTISNSQVSSTSISTFYEYYVVVWGFDNGPTTTVFLSDPIKPSR